MDKRSAGKQMEEQSKRNKGYEKKGPDKSSVSDPCHFDTDPDLWIRNLDYGSGSRSCSF